MRCFPKKGLCQMAFKAYFSLGIGRSFSRIRFVVMD